MTNLEQNRCKRILEAKQREVERRLRRRDSIQVQRTPDALDEVREAAETEVEIRNLDRECTLLREIRGALCRAENGSFGICIDFGEEITPQRLAAVPWTSRCINCQQQAERPVQTDPKREQAANNCLTRAAC